MKKKTTKKVSQESAMLEKNKVKEIVQIVSKDISILVEIDYVNNRISIVRPINDNKKYEAKGFVFSGRGVEYMNGWIDILDAQKVAIKEAKKMYEEELERTSKNEVFNNFVWK